jgi:acetoin utilization protein AcuB
MLVKNWMRQPAITIDADDVVTDAATLLREHEIRMLPVMRKGKLVGIITDRDINIASASDVPFENMDNDSDLLSDIKINTIMTSDPVTVPYDYTLEETVEKFLVQNISGLPVVNEQQNVLGVITRSDLFHLILILTGFGKKGLQIALDVEDRPGCLKKITDIIRDYDGRIASILSTQERADKGHRRLYIRVFDIDQPGLQHLRKILKEKTTLLYIVDYTRGQRELFGERKGIQNGRI